MAETRLSVRVPSALAARLDRIAKATSRSRSELTLRALELYCEREEGILEKIRVGLAGRAVSHERVAPWLRDLAQGTIRRRPKKGTDGFIRRSR